MRSPKQRQKWAPLTKPSLPQSWICIVLILFVLIVRIQGRRHPCQPLRNKIQCDNNAPNPFSFLWKVRRDPPAFFLGTIHVPYTKVWDNVPARAKSAFRSSQRVVFELDIWNEATLESITKCQYLPDNEALSDVIPKEMFNRLRRHLQWVRHQIPLWLTDGQRSRGLVAERLYSRHTENWERKRPIWAIIMINTLTESDVRSQGVPTLDSYLANEAIRMDKKIGSVEYVEEHCGPLNALNKTQVLFVLNQTLLQHEAIRNGAAKPQATKDELSKHYNCGNLDELFFNHEASQLPMFQNSNDSQIIRKEDAEMTRKIDDYFKRETIVARNRRMSERTLSLLDTNRNESFFFVFGAGHFFGRNSIIDFMIEAGHEITQVVSLEPRQLQQRPFTSQRCQQYLKQRNRKLATNTLNKLPNINNALSQDSRYISGQYSPPVSQNSFIYNELPPLSAETINTGQNLLPEQRSFPANLFSAASREQLNKQLLQQQQQQQQQQASNPFQNLNRFQPYHVKDYGHPQQHHHHHQNHHHHPHHHHRHHQHNGGNHQSQGTLEQMPTQSQSSLSSAVPSSSSPSSSSPPSNARHYFVFNQLHVRTYLDEQNYTDIVLNKWPFMPEGASSSSSSSSTSSSSSPSSASSSSSESSSLLPSSSSSSYPQQQQQPNHRNLYRLPL